ncbi:MAG: sigma-70 family RNA polymerase sigma factor [Verrucomicrobiota bacterium]
MASGDSESIPGVPKTPVFATTRWTLVLAAAETQCADSASALEALCLTYWYPLYAFVRRKGHPPDEAKDLTQEFFAQLIEKKLYQAADRSRGKFRTFLLTALQNFLNNQARKANAQKRGGGAQVCSLDFQDAEGRYVHEPSHALTPEKLFEREWANTLLRQVLTRLREEFIVSGQAERFDALSAHLVEPDSSASYSELAARLHMTEGAVKTAMHRLRRRYRELYRQEIARVVGDDAEVDEEIRHLVSALAA